MNNDSKKRQWLIDARHAANRTQADVAQSAGIKQRYYSAIENGDRGSCMPARVAKGIAKTLGLDWQKFYE